MNKLSIFFLGALGLMAVSCDDNHIEPATPQQNPQQPVLTAADIKATITGPLAGAEPTVVLEDYNYENPDNKGTKIPVIQLGEVTNMPEGGVVDFKFELSPEEDFSNSITLNTTAGTTEDTSSIYYVDAEQWNDAHLALLGRGKGLKTMYYRVPLYVDLDESNYRVESTDYYVADGKIEESRMDRVMLPDMLYTPGDANDWKFEESSYMQLYGGNSDGFYYGLFPVVIGYGFKITTEPNWDAQYGAADDTAALAGVLVAGDAAKNIIPPAQGLYWVKVNYDLETSDLTSYEMTEVTTLSLMGSFLDNNWASDVVMTSADGGATWTADVTFVEGSEFKFRCNNDWAIQFGGPLDRLYYDSNAANIPAPGVGDYTVTLYLTNGYPRATVTAK